MNEKTEFSKTIDDFLEGKINPTSHIFVCKTTNAMKACGAGNLDVMIYQDTIRKILSNDFNNFEHPHNLTVDTIKQLPKQLEKPVMVFKGSHEGSIVLITDLFNENNEQIIISCELASGSEWNKINRVTSMYGKENITNYLKAQIKKGNLIGCQKNIANQMLHSVGLYLPSENTFIDYTDIIPIYDKNVNINETKQFDNTLSKGESKMEDTKLNPQHNVKFMWNGIKIDGQLYKGKYSIGPYSEASSLPEGTVTIYMDTSRTPRIESLEIKNESDIMTDYFENDTVRIRPGTIHYDAAVKATNAYNIHMEKVAIRQFQKLSEKRAGSPMEEYYKQELENHKAALEKLQNPQQNNIKPLSKTVQDNTNPESQVKTLSDWEKSDKTYINDYLQIGDIVDTEMYNYFANILPPQTDQSALMQVGGTACEYQINETGILNPTYITFTKESDGNWKYRGECFSGEWINRNPLLEVNRNTEQLQEYNYQRQHLDKLQAIAVYEQELNVSPEERIVEINYATAHWQPKERITPDQAEAVYDYITDNQRIGFERANEIRQGVGQLPLTADEYYSNIKYMAYVSRFDFGDENSIDIEAIQSALNEVPAEYVISQMTSEQLDLYADYYETSLDFAGNADVNLSAANQQLYEIISHTRNNNLSTVKEPPNNVLNKSYMQTLLNEEALWKVGESNTFSYRGENFILKKEHIDNRDVFSIYKDETAHPLYQSDSMETVLTNFITDNQIDKSIYSGEVSVYFDGDNVSITDKYNHRIVLQPADHYSYANIEEYLNGIATIYPEYKQYIEENIAELSSNYENAIQTASDEAKSVRLAQLEADMYEGGGYGEDAANSRAEAEITHLREDLNNANQTELKNNKIRFKVLEADPITGYKYNVQVHFSHGFHENFVYSGMGRFCENPEEVKKYINKIIKEYSDYEYQFSYEGIDKNEFGNNTPFSNEILENSVEPISDAIPHLTLNEYLAQQGLASPVDDFMIDKIKLPHGQSKYDERKMHENARKSSQEYHDKRDAAIKEYQAKVEAGEIIEPTNLERYMKTASGNPDKASVQAAQRVLEKRGYTQNNNGDWVMKESPGEQTTNPNTLKIKNLLEQNNELPSDILSNKDLIKWYSFTSQINDIQATEEALQSILKNDMQVVSIENTANNQFRLVNLNEHFKLQQFGDKIYSSEKEAMNNAYSNNSIAKIVSHQNMLNSSNHQNLESIAGADNLKYPHIQILNSDNEIINQEDRLSLQEAEKLLSEQAEVNQENGIAENAEINLFLDNINTYHFNIGLGNSGCGIINHIKQYLNNIQSEITNNQSLQTLQEYIQNNYPDTTGTENVLHQQMKLTDCFDFTS